MILVVSFRLLADGRANPITSGYCCDFQLDGESFMRGARVILRRGLVLCPGHSCWALLRPIRPTWPTKYDVQFCGYEGPYKVAEVNVMDVFE